MKLLYCSGVWSYVVGALSTPTFIIIPLITIWAGIFPIVISWWAALGLTVYMLATMLVRRPACPQTQRPYLVSNLSTPRPFRD